VSCKHESTALCPYCWAERQGQNAAKEGYTDNPNFRGTKAWFAWEEGYRDERGQKDNPPGTPTCS